MGKERTYKFKMNNPAGNIPKDGFRSEVTEGLLLMPRLMRPKELEKYDLVDLNKGFSKLTIYRSSINMKQTKLAELTGFSLRTIQGWELRGLNEASAYKAVRVADALKCNVKDLMEEE